MKDEKIFREALRDKQIPLLTLDEKWQRLFAVHGKTEQILEYEKELHRLLSEQGKCNQELKELRGLKSRLLENIICNMNGANADWEDSIERRKLEEDKRLIGEINQKIEALADRLLELPRMLRQKNEDLMIASMEYGYEKMRINQEEAVTIGAWIDRIRVELKENIIRKQNCETNTREIYGYMHDIFGLQLIDLYDMQYEYEQEE